MFTRIVSCLFVLMVSCVFSQEMKEVVCTQEAMVCSDGSEVGRNPANNCEFDPCPDNSKNNAVKEKEKCVYFIRVDMH